MILKNEITVKYNNQLNTAVMENWKSIDFNLFFAILAKVKETGTAEHVFTYKEIAELIQFDPKQSRKKLNDYISQFAKKVSSVYFYDVEKNGNEDIILLFARLRPQSSSQILIVNVSEYYEHILNKLTKNFTIFELAEFVRLSSTYSKTMYRLLKQWRTVGKKRFKKEDLFMLLDVPKSTQTTGNFNNRVIDPIKKELTAIFKGLKIDPIRAKTQGRPITHYEFTWKPETTGNWIDGKYDKPNGKYKKQELIPDWMNDDYKKEATQPPNTDREAEIRAKIERLFGESE